jgi:DinB family protein
MDATRFFSALHSRAHFSDVYGQPSFADRVFGNLTDAQMRARPVKGVNSLVWLLWHTARVEDVAINIVICARAQVFDDGWSKRLAIPFRDIGSGMSDDEVAALSARVDVAAVRAYRSAVGARTRDIVGALSPDAWEGIITQEDTARAAAVGAFGQSLLATSGNPWRGNPRGTQLLVSAIDHHARHIGEAITIRGLGGFPLNL